MVDPCRTSLYLVRALWDEKERAWWWWSCLLCSAGVHIEGLSAVGMLIVPPRGVRRRRRRRHRLAACVRSGTHVWFMRCRGKFIGSRPWWSYEKEHRDLRLPGKRGKVEKSSGETLGGRKRSGCLVCVPMPPAFPLTPRLTGLSRAGCIVGRV